MSAKTVDSQRKEKKAKKKIGTVQVVATMQPSQKTEAAPSSKDLKTHLDDQPAFEEAVPPPLQLDPKLVAMAKQFNVPLDQIVKWAQKKDLQINQLQEAIETLGVKLQPLMTAIEKSQQTRAQTPQGQPMPTAGGQGGLQMLMQILPALVGGGGGENPMTKRLMEMSLKRMEADIGFTEAIKNVIVTKLAGKAAASLVE